MGNEAITGIMIPSAPHGFMNLARVQGALKYDFSREVEYLIAGHDNSLNEDDSMYVSGESEGIMYRTLREAGVSTKKIHVEENNRNSIENYLTLVGQFYKNNDDVGISTDWLHFQRFKIYHKQALKDEVVTPGFNIHHLPVTYGFNIFKTPMRAGSNCLAFCVDLVLTKRGLEKAKGKKNNSPERQNLKKKIWK